MQTYKNIDEYLKTQPLEYQKEFEKLRKEIKKILPNATEKIGRWMPWFQINGKWVIGFAGFKKHMSLFPYSGTILSHFSEELKDYWQTKSSLHFTVQQPLPKGMLKKIIDKKLEKDIV